MLSIICVLKSGGVYNEEYVDRLRKQVAANITRTRHYRFICLSDLPDSQHTPLTDDLPTWWSKLEAFKIEGPAIYIDLDTVILKSLDVLANELIVNQRRDTFYMLKAFNFKERFASGIMAWTGDWSWIHSEFNRDDCKLFDWDQRYIRPALEARNIHIKKIQDCIPHIYSYKHHCVNGVPDNAEIICFHGKPKPHEVRGVFWN